MRTDEGLMPLYNRAPITVAYGSGAWLTDVEGRSYLDCVSGVATNALGHAHPKLVKALSVQAGKLWHVSNMMRIPGQEELARKLTAACFADVAYFANSGTEAIECAIKAARRHHAIVGDTQRIDVIGFSGAFHGRTYAAVNAAGNPAYLDGFGPRLPGFLQLSVDDDDGICQAIARPTTAAVIVEPVQGEGGARALTGPWMQRIRRLTKDHGVLLIHDEVQCGMGRTGQLFAHQWFDDAEPDLMAIAKALGGGFPVGACLATRAAARGMTVGIHGTTFGGNPLAMAVALAVFDEIAKEETLAEVRAASANLATRLNALCAAYPDVIMEVRGKGLLIGLKLVTENREFIKLAREAGILIAGGGENCVRILPPLNISASEIEEVAMRLKRACAAARAKTGDIAS